LMVWPEMRFPVNWKIRLSKCSVTFATRYQANPMSW
jgi:hypothetical protein